MRISIKHLILVTLTCLCLSENVPAQYSSIYLDKASNFHTLVDHRFDDKAVARAKYIPSLLFRGFDQLHILTNPDYEDSEQAYAAGYLEGKLTHRRIYSHHRNLEAKTWKDGEIPENVQEFISEQDLYIKEQYEKNPSDEFWTQANNMRQQLHGMIDGYNSVAHEDHQLNLFNFHTMASFGDLFDIIYYKDSPPEFDKFSAEELKRFIWQNTHCSALIKVAEDYSDLWFGHNSWFHYTATTRIMKEYTFKYKNVKSQTVVFSSYAATLASVDDYYVTSSDMVVIETTNPMFNRDLYSHLTPKSVLCWQRAMIANRLTDNSSDWTKMFVRENSGTYNNQFMALDLKQVDTEARQIGDDALYIVEQIPGDYEINNVTEYLKYGYWPSYNVPFSKRIRQLSEFDKQLSKHPELKDTMDYSTCARANIFRRDQGRVASLEDFQGLIRSNNFQRDPLSGHQPGNAVASRFDLTENGDKSLCMGAYDAKAASIKDVKGQKVKSIQVIGGPTHETQEPFSWSESRYCKDEVRVGLPERFDFNWFTFRTSRGFESDTHETLDSLKFLE